MSKKTDLIQTDYRGTGMTFDEGAWFNATKASAFFKKRPIDWLKLKETEAYIERLCNFHKVSQNHFIKTKRGKNVGGTWFHPRLAVPFARWCNIDFAIWCDDQISKIIQGNHPHFDWKKLRHETTSSFKVLTESLRLEREYQGKAAKSYHYMNEAKLINWALSGEFKSLDRDALSHEELDLLAKLEVRDSALIGRGMAYDDRKSALKLFVEDWKIDRIKKLEKNNTLREAAL